MRIAHHILRRDADANDVLVTGQHRIRLRRRADAGHVDVIHAIDDRRIPVQTGIQGIGVLAEPEHHTALGLIDQMETGPGPDHDRNDQYQNRQYEWVALATGTIAAAGTIAARTGTLAATAQQTIDLVLKLLQRFIEIRWPLIATAVVATITTRASAPSAAPGVLLVVATTRLIPSHT